MTETTEDNVVALKSDVSEVVFNVDPYERQVHTVHGVADLIIQHAPKLKSKRKWLEATIKRLVHAEKYDVYSRVGLYFDELRPVNREFLDSKIETHKRLKDASDTDVVTW